MSFDYSRPPSSTYSSNQYSDHQYHGNEPTDDVAKKNWDAFKSPVLDNDPINSMASMIQNFRIMLSSVLAALQSGNPQSVVPLISGLIENLDDLMPPPMEGFGPPAAPPPRGSYPPPSDDYSYLPPPPSDDYGTAPPPDDGYGYAPPPNDDYGYSQQPRRTGMNADRALSTIYGAFDEIKSDDKPNLTYADLEAAAQSDSDASPDVRRAARFLLNNPNVLAALDTAYHDNIGEPATTDGEYGRADFMVAMGRQRPTGGDTATLNALKNNADELFANGGALSLEDLNQIVETGKLPSGESASPSLLKAAQRVIDNPALFDRLDSAASARRGQSELNGTFDEADIDALLGDPLPIGKPNGKPKPEDSKGNNNGSGQTMAERQALGLIFQNSATLFPDGKLTQEKIKTLLADPKVEPAIKDALRTISDPKLFDALDARGGSKDGSIDTADFAGALADGKPYDEETKPLTVVANNWNAVVGKDQPFQEAKIDEYIEKAKATGDQSVVDAFTFLKNNPALMSSLDIVHSDGAPERGKADEAFDLNQLNTVIRRGGAEYSDGGTGNGTGAPMAERQALGLIFQNSATLFPDGKLTQEKIKTLLADPKVEPAIKDALKTISDPKLFDALDERSGKDGSINTVDFAGALADGKPYDEEMGPLTTVANSWNAVVGKGKAFEEGKIDQYIENAKKTGDQSIVDAYTFLKNNPALMSSLDIVHSDGAAERGAADEAFDLNQLNTVIHRGGVPYSDGGAEVPAGNGAPGAMTESKAVATFHNNFGIFGKEEVTREDLQAKVNDPATDPTVKEALQMILNQPGLYDRIDERSESGSGKDGKIRQKDIGYILADRAPTDEEKPHLETLKKHWRAIIGESSNFEKGWINEYRARAQTTGDPEALKAINYIADHPNLLAALDVQQSGDGTRSHGKNWSGTFDDKFNFQQLETMLNKGTTGNGTPPTGMPEQEALGHFYANFDKVFGKLEVNKEDIQAKILDPGTHPLLKKALETIVGTPGLFDKIDNRSEGGSLDGKIRLKDIGYVLADRPPSKEEKPHLDALIKHYDAIVGNESKFEKGWIDQYRVRAQATGDPAALDAINYIASHPGLLAALDVQQSGKQTKNWSGNFDDKFNLEQLKTHASRYTDA